MSSQRDALERRRQLSERLLCNLLLPDLAVPFADVICWLTGRRLLLGSIRRRGRLLHDPVRDPVPGFALNALVRVHHARMLRGEAKCRKGVCWWRRVKFVGG